MRTMIGMFILCGACSSTPSAQAPTPESATMPEHGTTAVEPSQPKKEAAIDHLKKHVTYPATRQEILAACATTTEFTGGENAWFSTALPEGTYKTADEVIQAMKLDHGN